MIALSITATSAQGRGAAAVAVTQACNNSHRLETNDTDDAYSGKCAHAIEQTKQILVEVGQSSNHWCERNAAQSQHAP